MKLIKANVFSGLQLYIHNNPPPKGFGERIHLRFIKLPQLGKLGVMSCYIIGFILFYNEASYITETSNGHITYGRKCYGKPNEEPIKIATYCLCV